MASPIVDYISVHIVIQVKYSSELFDGLIKQLKTNHQVFNAVDRAGILMDASKVAVIGELNYGKLFELLTYIEKENDYGPISAGIDILTEIEFNIRCVEKCPS